MSIMNPAISRATLSYTTYLQEDALRSSANRQKGQCAVKIGDALNVPRFLLLSRP